MAGKMHKTRAKCFTTIVEAEFGFQGKAER